MGRFKVKSQTVRFVTLPSTRKQIKAPERDVIYLNAAERRWGAEMREQEKGSDVTVNLRAAVVTTDGVEAARVAHGTGGSRVGTEDLGLNGKSKDKI